MAVVRSAQGAAIGALLLLSAGLAGGCSKARTIAREGGTCTACHGGLLSQDGAPPHDLRHDPGGPGVGAHQAHLAHGVACAECHLVPGRTTAPGHLSHLDGTPDGDGRAELTFSGRAIAGGVTGGYQPATRTCAVYCHGASLGADGPAAAPRWSDAGPLGCGGCHGAPPPSAPHVAGLPLTTCAGCHPDTVDAAGGLLASGRHLDGTVDARTGGCASCHGDPTRPEASDLLRAAPPGDVAGGQGPAVGAHQAHLHDGPLARALACQECHDVPGDVAHAAGVPEVVVLATAPGRLAGAAGVTPTWSGATCSVYCHGASLDGGSHRTPGWTDGPASVGFDDADPSARCTSCHGAPPPPPHPASTLAVAPIASAADCSGCHAGTVAPDGALLTDLHVDGLVELGGAHPVPWASRLHGPAALAGLATCAACHGATFASPLGARAVSCDGCHAEVGHPTWQRECTFCHGDRGGTRAADPAAPLVGQPPVPLDRAGPPVAATARPVGPHLAHVSADPAVGNRVSSPIACSECHGTAPADLSHVDGAVRLAWGPLAGAGGVTTGPAAGLLARADEADPSCSNACHGAALTGGAHPSPRWGDGAAASACGACHGLPPATHPPAAAGRCWGCHPDTVKRDGTLDLAGGTHVDGRVESSIRCDACHGAPPATGAHARHATRALAQVGYGDLRILEEIDPGHASRQADYAFGCGFCHPLDPARHLDGVVQVELTPAGARAGSLRAANRADAAYHPASGTCSGVACHASGQAAPAFVDTTAWSGGTNPAGCFGCHGDPPAYPNGGPGAADANLHLASQDPANGSGWTWGHAGAAHSFQHGGVPPYEGQLMARRASQITCQACHFDTVDPANTAPGGFMYLDTGIDTALPSDPNWPSNQHACQGCHSGAAGGQPAGAGKVRPLRHVNGRRDVVFDPRVEVPDGYEAGYTATVANYVMPAPVRPYFIIYAFDHFWTLPPLTPATVVDYTGVAPGLAPTLSFPLTEASYDPATKSCSTVACHFKDSPLTQWGEHWVTAPDRPDGCNTCH